MKSRIVKILDPVEVELGEQEFLSDIGEGESSDSDDNDQTMSVLIAKLAYLAAKSLFICSLVVEHVCCCSFAPFSVYNNINTNIFFLSYLPINTESFMKLLFM